MPSRVQIDISAQDNASATLDSVRQKLVLFDQFGRQASDLSQKFEGVERSVGGLDISASKATRAVRGLVVPLVSELSPALGQTASGLASVVTSALLLGSGMSALGIAAVGAAGVIGGQFVESMRKAEQRAADLRKAESGLTFDTLVSGATAARLAVQDLTDQLDRLRGIQKEIAAAPSNQRTSFAVGSVLGVPDSDEERKRKLDEWVAAGRRADTFQRGRTASDFARAEQDDAGLGTTTNEAAQQARQRLADIRKQVAEVGILDPIERAFQSAMREAETVRQQFGGGAEQGQIADRLGALARASRDEALRRRGIGLRLGGEAGYDEGLAYGITLEDVTQGSFAAQRKAFEGQEPAPTPGIEDVTDFEALSPQVGPTAGDVGRARKSITDADLRDSERLLSIDRDRILLQTQRTDLSLRERETLDAAGIQADYLLKLEQARGDAAKELGAEVERRIKLQQLEERTNPVAGFRRGLTDVEQEFGSAGLRMQETARTVGGDIARSLSDSMLGPVEERIKNLPPLFRSMLLSLTRAVTDDIGKAITAQLFSGIKGLLPGGGGPSGLVPFGEGGGAGGGPPSVTNVTLNVAGRPLAESELRTAYTAAGDEGVRALRAGEATVVGDQYIPRTYGLTSPEATQSSYALMRPQPGFFDRALPIAGNAAALGLTAFGAQGARTGFDIGASTALGGVTGAGLGQSLAPLLGVSGGYGAAGGALAGAAITGTMAALAKAAADKQAAKERQAAEVARAAGAGGDLVSSAGQAQSPADLFRRLTAFGSGTTGGGANPAVPVTVQTPQGPRFIGRENPTYPVATLQDLLAHPESLQANIQAGVDPSQLAGPNAATSTALQKIATDMVAQFRETEQGVGVTEEDRVMPSGLRRRTTVPANLAGTLGGGGDLEVDELALDALSDDDQAAILLDVLGQTAQNRDIVSTISDGATGQIVSITRIPRSTISLPPATTPVPAPVTPSTSPVTTPPPSTTELLSLGGAAAIGLAASLANPNSTLNQLLPTGWTGADLAAKIQELFSTGSLSGTAGTVALGDLEAAGRDLFSSIDTLGAAAESGFGFAQGLAVLEGLGGVFGLVQGAQAGDPLSITKSVIDLYSAVSTLSGNAVPGLLTLAGQAYGVLTGVGASAGAEVAATALAAAGPYLAIAGPIIQGLIQWAMTKDQIKDLQSWAVIGKAATAMQTAAQQGLSQAAALFATIEAQGITEPTILRRAIELGSNGLLAYHRTIQGPGGPISVSDFYKFTGQSAALIQQLAASVQGSIVKAIAKLEAGGATPQSLANLASSEWGEAGLAGSRRSSFFTPADIGAAASETLGIIGGPRGTAMLFAQSGEGDVPIGEVETGGPAAGNRAIGGGFSAEELAGFNALFPQDTINTEFGGPLFSMLAYLMGPSTLGTGGQPYFDQLAAQGVTTPGFNRTASPSWLADLIRAIAAQRQAEWTAGGGDAGATGGPGAAAAAAAAAAASSSDGGPAGVGTM